MIPYLTYYAQQMRYDDLTQGTGFLPGGRSLPSALPVEGLHPGRMPQVAARAAQRARCSARATARALGLRRGQQAGLDDARPAQPAFGGGQ